MVSLSHPPIEASPSKRCEVGASEEIRYVRDLAGKPTAESFQAISICRVDASEGIKHMASLGHQPLEWF